MPFGICPLKLHWNPGIPSRLSILEASKRVTHCHFTWPSTDQSEHSYACYAAPFVQAHIPGQCSLPHAAFFLPPPPCVLGLAGLRSLLPRWLAFRVFFPCLILRVLSFVLFPSTSTDRRRRPRTIHDPPELVMVEAANGIQAVKQRSELKV